MTANSPNLLEYPYVSYSTSSRRSQQKGDKERLYIAQKRKCRWCGRFCSKVGLGGEPTQFTVDHVIPLGVGGTKHWMNTVGSCFKCNRKRNIIWGKRKIVKLLNPSQSQSGTEDILSWETEVEKPLMSY